jgi:hypothetical protein
MVKAEYCAITVEFALALKNLNPALGAEFHCTECGRLVDAHKAGEGPTGVKSPARFEHRKRNPKCPLSHLKVKK